MVRLHARSPNLDADSIGIASLWWTLALRGAGVIGLGTLAAFWPSMTFFMLVGCIAAYSIMNDVLSLMVSVE
jgi:uncharacterized membrane protein HdeD (DUF308 family)